MKVTVKQQPEEFKPVTLGITLESRDELGIMHEIFYLDVTIPEALRRFSKSKVEALLNKVSSEILNVLP